jgi:hypothetical protein
MSLLIQPVIDVSRPPAVTETVREGHDQDTLTAKDVEVVDDATELDEWTPVIRNRGTSRVGRITKAPTRLIEEMNAFATENYYQVLSDGYLGVGDEYALVGAGLGGGFEDTTELHVLKYKQAMATPEKEKWKQAVKEEHERMKEHNVWDPVPKTEIPKGGKVLTTTWAMKRKANGKFRARLNARGYEQVDGIHYDEDTKAAPVTNETSIRIIMVLMVMANWAAHVIDVQGAFLNGRFDAGEELYLRVPEGFEDLYPSTTVLKLRRTIYGLKQAAYAFWIELLKAFESMSFTKSDADPCLYYRWTSTGLTVWLSWVDDCLVVGSIDNVLRYKAAMMDRFACDDVGELREYI